MNRSPSATPPPRQRAGTRALLVAGPGYGKSTSLEATAAFVWRAADLITADLVPSTIEATVEETLAVDDVHELSGSEQVGLLRLVHALPGQTTVWLAGRRPLLAEARATLRGPLFERGPADLALPLEQVARVLRDEHGVVDTQVATTVHELTCGWPLLVQLAGDAAARGATYDDLLDALSERGTAAATWLTEQVFPDLPDSALATLRLVAGLDPLTIGLVDQLAGAAAESDFLHLDRSGLLLPHSAYRRRSDGPRRLVPVVAAVLNRSTVRRTSKTAPATSPMAMAAAWYDTNGFPLAAARAYAGCGQPAAAADVVRAQAEQMLASGAAGEVAALLADSPLRAGDPQLQLVYADALRTNGDGAAARRAFAPLVDEARRTGNWSAGLVWRLATLSYMCGEYAEALDHLHLLPRPHQPTQTDEVLLLACWARVLGVLGSDGADEIVTASVRAAELLGEAGPLAAAHLAGAVAESGTGSDAHLALAREAALRAGDEVQLTLVGVNQSYSLLAAARYDEAARVAAEAARSAELGNPSGRVVAALHNLGESLMRVGRFDEAELHLQRAVDYCHRRGLQRTAFGHYGLAEIHRQLGRREQGIAAYEQALAAARAADEVQVLVPALAGLCRLLLDPPTDVDAARVLADEAVAAANDENATYALTARGFVALADGDRAKATELAARSMSAARAAGLVDALAEALELSAAASSEPSSAEASLREAVAIWRAGGAQPAADRLLVLLGQLPCADGETRSEAREATRRLTRLGIRTVNGRPVASSPTAEGVDVQVIGGFEVRVGGQPVQVQAWRSKQARTLVKLLASRRGRPITRSEVCELLWPDDDPAKTAHRLSVLLNVVRQVLDPDRRLPPDYYITADLWGLSLDVSHVGLDVEQLLQDCRHGAGLLRDGDLVRARETLAAVVTQYQGDAFEEEPYEAWAEPLREEARAAWTGAMRQLALAFARSGMPNDACALLVRLLAIDAYDESSHSGLVRLLVRAGRHGEARRAFERWTAAMAAIDAPPPDPDVLSPTARTRPATSPAPPKVTPPATSPAKAADGIPNARRVLTPR